MKKLLILMCLVSISACGDGNTEGAKKEYFALLIITQN